MENLSEERLIMLARMGDKEAFTILISPMYKPLYNLCYSLLFHEEDAKDAAQESVIKAYKAFKGFKADSKFSTWLYRIAVNTAKDFLAKRAKDLHVPLDEVENFPNLGERDEYGNVEKELDVYRCLQKLSPDMRELIVLRDMRGLSYEEISRILDKNEGSVKSGLNRARARLAAEFAVAGLITK